MECCTGSSFRKQQSVSVSVVTGGAGFIGSHLAARLARDGQQVRVLDSLTGEASQRRAARLAVLPGIEIVRGDIRDAALCRQVLFDAEWVFHHAAEVSVPQSVADPAACIAVNLGGTVNLLEAVRASGTLKRFVLASSCAVYGDAPGAEKSESSVLAPLSPYATSKLAGEYLCRNYFALHGVQTVCLRYFNAYGPDQDPNGAYAAVIPKFISAILAKEMPTVYGDGEQSRDFVFVEDIVDANLRAAVSEKAIGQSLNIGSGRSVTLNEILAKLAGATGRAFAVDRQPARAGDIKHSRADIASAANLLEFSPKTTLEDGLARTLHWYQSEATHI